MNKKKEDHYKVFNKIIIHNNKIIDNNPSNNNKFPINILKYPNFSLILNFLQFNYHNQVDK